ncbi:hypothetical protein B0H10DRAFT_2438455 [Mycena sp. CBHHK59/15]|nr:hypothetical protein B0H10DRAFT_2438455 [Mycena sp. CBHHK59/15]
MFSSKLGCLFLSLSFSHYGHAAALSNVQASTSPTSGGTVAVTWSSDASDTCVHGSIAYGAREANDLAARRAPFTISLFSTSPTFVRVLSPDLRPPIDGIFVSQNGGFAIANNVNPQDNKATIALPNVVPGPGYAISFISMSDTSNVLATSPSFSIGTAASASVSTPAVSNTGAVSSVSGASRSGSTAGGRAPAASSARSTSASATAPLSSASASVSASLSSASASISAPSPPPRPPSRRRLLPRLVRALRRVLRALLGRERRVTQPVGRRRAPTGRLRHGFDVGARRGAARCRGRLTGRT